MYIDFNNYTIKNKSQLQLQLQLQKQQKENSQTPKSFEQRSYAHTNLNNMPVYYLNFKGDDTKKHYSVTRLKKPFQQKTTI